MAISAIIRVTSFGPVCPHCGDTNTGFHSDPRGTNEVFRCEYCEESFTVDESAIIELI